MKKLLLAFCLLSVAFANAQWVEQSSGFSVASRGISDIFIIDANTVWGLAYDGTPSSTAVVQEFTRTLDGGATWNSGTINVGDTTIGINDLSPVDASTAWVSATATTGGGVIWKTADGGATWTQQNASGYTNAASFLDGVHFFNASVGVSFGDPGPVTTAFEIYRTINGGTTWTSITSPAITSGDYGYNSGFTFVGNNIWFGTAKGKIYRSTDLGATWIKYSSPIPDFGAQDTATSSGRMYFSDANNGILIGNTLTGTAPNQTIASRKLYKTSNGGASWTAGVAYTQPYTFNLCYIPGTTMLVGNGVTTGTTPVQSTGYSTDNGTNWTQYDSGTQRTSIAFLNPNLGWAGGFSSADPLAPTGVFKFTGTLATQNFGTSKFKVFPNPATSTVTISAANVDSYQLAITDLTGKVVMTKSLNGLENILDISTLSSGAYFFELSADNKKEVIKVLKN